MYYIYTYIPATCLSSIMICFGASTLQKKALNNQNTGQNWVPGIYIYIYINLGDVAIFSLYMWLFVPFFCGSKTQTNSRAPNLIFLQGVHVVLPKPTATVGCWRTWSCWKMTGYLTSWRLWNYDPYATGKKNLISLYTYIDALRKYDPQIVLKQWWWWVPMVQK